MAPAATVCHSPPMVPAPSTSASVSSPRVAAGSAPVVRLKEIRRAFGEVEALRGVDVDIAGGVIGLLGPNGAGKTTLLRLLLGLDRANTGEVEVLGWPMPESGLPASAELGYMPEDDCLFPRLTGAEQVMHAARICGLSAADARHRSHRSLDLVGIGEARHRDAAGYSLGMRQRLRLAMAIVHGPRLLLLDEPTAGLDPAGRDELLAVIGEIGATGTSVMLSTHVLSDVEAVCDQVLLLSRGQLGFSGPMARFKAGASGQQWRLDVVGDAASAAAALKAAGIGCVHEGHLLTLRLEPDQHGLMWTVARDHRFGIRGLWPVQESIGDAFLRHLRLDDPARGAGLGDGAQR